MLVVVLLLAFLHCPSCFPDPRISPEQKIWRGLHKLTFHYRFLQALLFYIDQKPALTHSRGDGAEKMQTQ